MHNNVNDYNKNGRKHQNFRVFPPKMYTVKRKCFSLLNGLNKK